MSDVIEAYIRRNTGMSEETAFQGFLAEDRIRTWVGDDPTRKERLRREFARVWASLHPPATPSRQSPSLVRQAPPPSPAPAPPAARQVVEVQPPPAPAARAAHSRQLQVLCTVCGKFDVWLEDGIIACHACLTPYDNMLDLIPVKPVGVLEFYFGTGWQGAATAVGLVVGLVLLYLLLHGLS